ALGRTGDWGSAVEGVDGGLLEAAAEERQDTTITPSFLYSLHQPVMRNAVEIALEIGIDHERVAVRYQLGHFAQRIQAAPSRPKAVARRSEPRLKDRLECELHCRLDDAVLDRPDSQPPPPPITPPA